MPESPQMNCSKCNRPDLTEDDFYHDGAKFMFPCKQCRCAYQKEAHAAEVSAGVAKKIEYIMSRPVRRRHQIICRYLKKGTIGVEEAGVIMRAVEFNEE